MKANGRHLYEIEFKYADGINIFKDLDIVEREIWNNECVENKIYFASRDEALAYLKIKYDINKLVELVEGL